MTRIKSLNAEIQALSYVNEQFKPFESINGFSSYYIRIGEDVNPQPNSLYADTLPVSEMLLANDAMAINVFMDKCDTKNEYLIKVIVNQKSKNLDTKILMSPANLRNN